jgi:hypothetical protein
MQTVQTIRLFEEMPRKEEVKLYKLGPLKLKCAHCGQFDDVIFNLELVPDPLKGVFRGKA